MLYYKLRHSQSSECLNLRKKTRKSVWYNDHYLKGPGTIIFKKRFPKPDYKRKVISIIFPWFFFFFSSLPYLFFLADLLTKSFPLLTKQFINLVPLSIREGGYIYIYLKNSHGWQDHDSLHCYILFDIPFKYLKFIIQGA